MLVGEGVILGFFIFLLVFGVVVVMFNDLIWEEEIIVFKNVIIVIGFSFKMLFNLLLDEEFILFFDGMFELEELLELIVIIGGGVIGVEWVFLLNSLGVNVIIIEFLDCLFINESVIIFKELKKCLE